MPPSRRKPSNTTNARAQQTLAFGPTPNKITKASLPSAAASTKKKAPTDAERLQKAVTDQQISTAPSEDDDNTNDDEYPPPPERQLEEEEEGQASPGKKLAIRRAQGEAAGGKVRRSEAEEKAGKVSEAQIKRYWRGKEEERIAPRVHQAGLDVDEKILRHFDLSTQYGVRSPLSFLSFPFPSPLFNQQNQSKRGKKKKKKKKKKIKINKPQKKKNHK